MGNLNGDKESCEREEKKTLIVEKPFGKEEEDAEEPFGKEEDADLRKELGGGEMVEGGGLLSEEEKRGGQTQEKENSQMFVGEDVKGESEETREKAKQRRRQNVEERGEMMVGAGEQCKSVTATLEREEEYTQL